MTLRDDIAAARPDLAPFMVQHDHLCAIVPTLPGDYSPWGAVERWSDPDVAYPDCSGGCMWFLEIAGEHGADWGVCTSLISHRTGMLTFEHQAGMACFEDDGSDDK